MEYKVLNIDVFLTQTHSFASEGLYYPPEAVWSTFYDGLMHFLGLKISNTIHCHKKAWKSQDIFLRNSYCICLKEESHTACGCGPAVRSRSGAAAAVQLVYFCCAACAELK